MMMSSSAVEAGRTKQIMTFDNFCSMQDRWKQKDEYLVQPWKVPEGMEWPPRKVTEVRNSAIRPGRRSNGRGQVVQRRYFL